MISTGREWLHRVESGHPGDVKIKELLCRSMWHQRSSAGAASPLGNAG
jgi:hypothetical protein